MNSRLKQFLAAENISQSQFADTIGVARASISHILSGRNRPGYDFFASVAQHYPTLNLSWLITGKGRMYGNQPYLQENVIEIPSAASADSGLFADEEAEPILHGDVSSYPAAGGGKETPALPGAPPRTGGGWQRRPTSRRQAPPARRGSCRTRRRRRR